MAYPAETHLALLYAHPAAPEGAWSLRSSPSGVVVESWALAGVSRPTEAEVAAVVASPAFAAWLARRSDPLLAMRDRAAAALDARKSEEFAALRATILELLAYANAERAKFNDLLTWIGAQTTLTNRGALSGLSLGQATPAQARQAIKARIDAGEGD